MSSPMIQVSLALALDQEGGKCVYFPFRTQDGGNIPFVAIFC